MLTIARILCPTDFSQASFDALSHAVELARQFDSELILLHVEPLPLPAYGLPPYPDVPAMPPAEMEEFALEDARERLHVLLRLRVPADVRARVLVREGNDAQEILDAAAEETVDLIVIATHGLTGWRHMVFGSVAESVLRQARCPVLTIRAAEPAHRPAGLEASCAGADPVDGRASRGPEYRHPH